MPKCKACHGDIPKTDTCGASHLVFIPRQRAEARIEALVYPRDTSVYNLGESCHDCEILNHGGRAHHWHCDMERCPRCLGQLITCSCWADYEIMPFIWLNEGLGERLAKSPTSTTWDMYVLKLRAWLGV